MRTKLVVVGLGYVGMPLVRGAVHAGLRVAGLDVADRVVDGLRAGRSHVDDISDDDVRRMLAAGFEPTTEPGVLSDADAVVICVPTPLSADAGPDLAAVTSAVEAVRDHLHPGMLVVLESTTYPGTTDEVVRPILESTGLVAGRDFALAFSPERIDPGNRTYDITNTPKVVGGHTADCADRAIELYERFVDVVVRARGTREAEMAKLLENTYRHVNIALVNEMARFCHQMNVDLWDVIRCASTKPFGFQAFYPGPGVGGHCIPIDPNYLSYKVKTLGYPFRFVELAQEINEAMPGYVARRVQDALNRDEKALNGARVLLLGVTYKPDIADERHSPAVSVGARLLELGAHVSFHDPFVQRWRLAGRLLDRVDDLAAELGRADITVLLQPHADYDLEQMAAKARRMLDTRGQVADPTVERL
jgi:UDP-N-acetyl-D-glucosamine dehydrogenase